MKLETHIKQSGKTVTAYAKDAGLSHNAVYQALRGEFSEKTSLIIYNYSDKKVKLQRKTFQFD